MNKIVYDAIIIGQGLAGSVLFHLLRLRGLRTLVIDNGFQSSASMAAAGIYNPIIIKRLRKSWRGLEFIEFALNFFKKIETELGINLISSIPINRIFSSDSEYKMWEDKLLDEKWESLIGVCEKEILGKFTQVGEVKNTGWLNIPLFLRKSRNFLTENHLLLEDQFEFEGLSINSSHISYKDIEAKRIFFCEGYQVSKNPFFRDVPLSPVKGEILVIEDPEIKYSEIVHCGHFILPIGNHQYKVGATFSWDELNESPTNKAKDQLLKSIGPYTSDKLKVIDHVAGVRPAVIDRRPLIGTHKEQKHMHLFNGLGTRGVMLAPFLAENLFDHIFNEQALIPEADYSRFN